MGSFLNEINNFSKSKLKPTSTKISYLSGKQCIKNRLNADEKELTDDELKKAVNDDSNVSSTVYWSRFTGFIVDLIPDYTIDEIIPRLYLSGDDVATCKEILFDKNITHILNLTTNVPNKFENEEIAYLKIEIYDLHEQDIEKYFEKSFEFINNALNNFDNSVLVHCNAGISRSSSFIIAYLLQKRYFKTYKEAYEHVKSKRSKICPNDGFVRQLKSLESKLSKIYDEELKF